MFSEITIIKNKNGIEKVQVSTNFKEFQRDVIVQVGKEMVVKLFKKQKLKHRDRRVMINKIVDEGFKGVRASVKFLDNNRTGKVEIEDLDDLT